MTTDKSKKDFVKAEPMKGARLAEYRQSSYEAELRSAGYGKKAPHGEIDYIKPKLTSGRGRHSKL